MRTYIYNVQGNTFTDNEPWGKAWKEAKAKATELHTFITRKVIEEREEIYCFGCFFSTEKATPADAKIF